MSLPAAWTDRIFTKLTLTYGQAFLRQYDGVDMDEVKANWGHELACYRSPWRRSGTACEQPAGAAAERRAVPRALSHPAKPVLLTNDLPPVDPKMAAMVKDVLSKAERRIGDREWAERLKSKELAGARLTQYQRACWREALGGQQ
jgi:hypothetical protein